METFANIYSVWLVLCADIRSRGVLVLQCTEVLRASNQQRRTIIHQGAAQAGLPAASCHVPGCDTTSAVLAPSPVRGLPLTVVRVAVCWARSQTTTPGAVGGPRYLVVWQQLRESVLGSSTPVHVHL